MAKYCGHCGAEWEDTARVCGRCGMPLEGPPARIKGIKNFDPEKRKKKREPLKSLPAFLW